VLNIKTVLDNLDAVRDNIKARHVNLDIDEVVALYQATKNLKAELQDIQTRSNIVAREIPKASSDARAPLILEGKQLKERATNITALLTEKEDNYHEILLRVPNFFAPDTPIGKDDSLNHVVSQFKEKTQFSFKPKDHLELAQSLDILDFEAGAKVTGAKFYFLKNEGVFLEFALARFAMDMAAKLGYTPLITPDLAQDEIIQGAGYAPRGNESQIYSLQDLPLSLIGTSEITIGGMLKDTILKAEDLPLKFVAFSHCFRTEAGGHGRENKGLYRVHQFSKIELFQFTLPEHSDAGLEEIRSLEEQIYLALELPYQVVRVCSGDLGNAAYKKYDIEAWMPGKGEAGEFGEVTSASNCTDFQARRLNIRYKNTETGKNEFVHTLNGTAIALSRTPIALLENFQQQDGSIVIPKALQAYTGFSVIRPRTRP